MRAKALPTTILYLWSKVVERGGAMIDTWSWEGNVAKVLAAYLKANDWTIVSMADTAARTPGVDVLATKGTRRLAVEVKGYPTTVYGRGPKVGQPKPTQPANQARQWFAHAWVECLLMHDRDRDAEIGMALPDMPTFRGLLDRTEGAFGKLGIGVYLVSDDGRVRQHIEHRPLEW